MLLRLAASHHDAFELLLQVTYTGYYGHPHVQDRLRWADPHDAGYGIDQPLDERLLIGTRERGVALAAAFAADGVPVVRLQPSASSVMA